MVNCFSIGGGKKSPRPGIELVKDSKPNFVILNGLDRFFLKEEPPLVSQDNDIGVIEDIFKGARGPWVGVAPDGTLLLYSCEIGERRSVKAQKQCRQIYVSIKGRLDYDIYSLGDSRVLAHWFDLQKNTQEILVEINAESSAIAIGGNILQYRGNGKFISS